MDTSKSYERKYGYNFNRVAGSTIGYHHTESAKRKISAALRLRIRKPATEETRQKIRKWKLGKSASQDHKNNIQAGLLKYWKEKKEHGH